MSLRVTSIESELSDFPLFGMLLESSVCLFESISEEPVIFDHNSIFCITLPVFNLSWNVTYFIIKVIVPIVHLFFINSNILILFKIA